MVIFNKFWGDCMLYSNNSMEYLRVMVAVMAVFSVLIYGSAVEAQTSIPIELPDDVRAGAECHVISTLTLQVDLKLLKESTNTMIDYNKAIQIPKGARVPGKCSANSQDLYYFTEDGFLEINMKFHLKTEDDISVWNLDHLAILVLQTNISNIDDQHDQFAKRDRVAKQGTMLLRAPVNVTYQCSKVKTVSIYPSNIHSAMIFSQVQLQPYSDYVQLSSENGGYICPRRRHSATTESSGSGEFLVPIILATSLGIVVLLLLIGYLVLRKIGKLGYQNME